MKREEEGAAEKGFLVHKRTKRPTRGIKEEEKKNEASPRSFWTPLRSFSGVEPEGAHSINKCHAQKQRQATKKERKRKRETAGL